MKVTGPDRVWIGLDLGTGGARALAVTTRGDVVGSGRAPLRSTRSDGRHEQDPAAWWHAAAAALRAALRDVDGPIGGIAVDATSGTVVGVDRHRRPLTAGLMYDDARGASYVDRVDEVGQELWAALGYRRMQAGWALPKILWMIDHVPDLAGILHQADVITSRLVGEPAPTDLSTALKTGVDLRTGRWPLEVLDVLDVPPAFLPDLVSPGDPIGSVCPRAAGETGLPEGTPVYAGATDGYAGQLGSGALEVGSWSVVLGTTLVVKGVTGEPVADDAGAVYSHRGPGGTWFPGGASSTGAGALATLFAEADLDALTRAARPLHPASCVSYPLVGRGERFPFVAPDARGFALGRPVDDAEHFASVLQGVAFVERLALDALDRLGAPLHGRYVTTGGGARNDVWTQLRADVSRRPIEVPEQAGGALGMAVLAAAEGRGAGRLAEVASHMVRVHATFEPDAARSDAFAEPYGRLVDALLERGWVPAALAAHARERNAQ